jgi:hypothetical protein
MWSYLYVEPKKVKALEAESRTVADVGENGELLAKGSKFHLMQSELLLEIPHIPIVDYS